MIDVKGSFTKQKLHILKKENKFVIIKRLPYIYIIIIIYAIVIICAVEQVEWLNDSLPVYHQFLINDHSCSFFILLLLLFDSTAVREEEL